MLTLTLFVFLQNDKEEKKQERVRKEIKEDSNKKEEKQTGADNHMNGMATTAPTLIPQIKTENVPDETIPPDAPPPTALRKVLNIGYGNLMYLVGGFRQYYSPSGKMLMKMTKEFSQNIVQNTTIFVV